MKLLFIIAIVFSITACKTINKENISNSTVSLINNDSLYIVERKYCFQDTNYCIENLIFGIDTISGISSIDNFTSIVKKGKIKTVSENKLIYPISLDSHANGIIAQFIEMLEILDKVRGEVDRESISVNYLDSIPLRTSLFFNFDSTKQYSFQDTIVYNSIFEYKNYIFRMPSKLNIIRIKDRNLNKLKNLEVFYEMVENPDYTIFHYWSNSSDFSFDLKVYNYFEEAAGWYILPSFYFMRNQ